jgi:hypothetical protein
MTQTFAWNLPAETRGDIVDHAPSISQLYREMQVAYGALRRMSAILEHIAATMPPDGK